MTFDACELCLHNSGDYVQRCFWQPQRRPLDDCQRGLLAIAASCISGFIFFGCIATYPVAISYIAEDPTMIGRENSAVLNLSGSLLLGTSRGLGILAGTFMPYFGTQPMIVVAGICLGLAFLTSSFAPHAAALVMIYTFFMSFAFGFFVTPCICFVGSYFLKRRSIAMGIYSASTGLGSATLPLAFSTLCDAWARSGPAASAAGIWRPAFRIWSLLSLFMTATGFVAATRLDEVPKTPVTAERKYSRWLLMTSRAFWTLALECFMRGFSAYGVMFVIVPYALAQGHAPYAAVPSLSKQEASILMTIYGACGMCGSLFFGWLADRVGVCVAHGLAWSINAACILSWAFVDPQPYWLRCLLVGMSACT